MSPRSAEHPAWLSLWMEAHHIALWGAADLTSFATPMDDKGNGFPGALSFALPMHPGIMASIQNGPNQDYAGEYTRVNQEINQLSFMLADVVKAKGFRSQPLAASIRSDTKNIKGDFPHKTAATRAGIGWIGRHCQLVTRPYGPWVRLGTVFTNMELPYGPPKERSLCGKCRQCVDACPAGALTGKEWFPGIPRQEILEVRKCDKWKKDHYFEFHKGHNCGICSAVCPYGDGPRSSARGVAAADNRSGAVCVVGR